MANNTDILEVVHMISMEIKEQNQQQAILVLAKKTPNQKSRAVFLLNFTRLPKI
jgi:hypothetical protein